MRFYHNIWKIFKLAFENLRLQDSLFTILILVFLSINILALSLTVKASTPSYSWVYSGDEIIVNNRVFTVYISSDSKLLVKQGSGFVAVENNSCELFNETKICLRNIVTVQDKLRAYVETSFENETISISRTADKTNVRVGEEITFTLRINNSGINDVNFTYEDKLPQGLLLTNGSDSLTLRGVVKAHSLFEKNYKVLAVEQSRLKTRAVLKYELYGRQIDQYTNTLSMSILPSIEIRARLNTTEVFVGEETQLLLNFTNRINESKINISVIIPESAAIVYSTLTCNSKNFCSKEISLNENSSLSYTMKLRALRVSNSQIIIRAKNKFENVEYRINLVIKKFDVKITTSPSSISSESYSHQSIKVYIQNPSRTVKLKDVDVHFETELFNTNDYFTSELLPLNKKIVLNKIFTMPEVSARKIYRLKIRVSYKTEFGDSFNSTLTKDIVVEPARDITIIHNFKSQMEGLEEGYFEVKIKNNRRTNLTVNLSDEHSKGLIVSGDSKKVILVEPSSTVTAYKYKIKVPDVKKETEFKIETTAIYSYSNEVVIKSKISKIKVKPRKLNIQFSHKMVTSGFTGSIIAVNFTISNPESEPLYNIEVHMPEEKEFDFQDKIIRIKKLNPGEEISINDFWIRPKYNGTQYLGPIRVTYEDSYNNRFEKNTSKTRLSVKESYISEPAIVVSKEVTVLNTTQEKVLVNVKLNIENLGNKIANIFINDSNREFNVSINPKSRDDLNYSLEINAVNKTTLSFQRAIINYNIFGKSFKTFSNKISLNLDSYKNKAEQVAENTLKQTGNEKKTNEETNNSFNNKSPVNKKSPVIDNKSPVKSKTVTKSKEEAKKEGILNRILNFIIKLLYFRRK